MNSIIIYGLLTVIIVMVAVAIYIVSAVEEELWYMRRRSELPRAEGRKR